MLGGCGGHGRGGGVVLRDKSHRLVLKFFPYMYDIPYGETLLQGSTLEMNLSKVN